VLNIQDAKYVVDKQYKSAENLRARIELHERFSTFKQDFHAWIFNQIKAPEGAKILELGCGSAALWTKNRERISSTWHLTLTDLSPGMVREAKEATKGIDATFNYEVVDAQTIPFEDASFDVVIANHMLYHVPKLDKAISEVRRVLKPGGHFYAATNGENHMRELDNLSRKHLDKWLDLGDFKLLRGYAFRLEDGAESLAKQFSRVEKRVIPNNALEITEAEPLIAYILSTHSVQSSLTQLSQEDLDSLLSELRKEIEGQLEQGAIHVTKSTGLFVAS